MRYSSRLAAASTLIVAFATAGALAEGVSISEANVKELEAGDVVKVSKIPDGVYLRTVDDPDDAIWERLPEYRVRLALAPPVHESVELRIGDDDQAQDVYLNLAKTSDRFYVRMRWRDDTRDVETLHDRFRDGAAVQFSLGNDETSPIMGTGPDEPVNIWYWRPDNGSVSSLAAGGPGSTTMLEDQPVTGSSRYDAAAGNAAGVWTVVMSRPIAATGEYQVSLDRDAVPLGFALWQGSNEQRDGFKTVSDGWIIADMTDPG